MENRFTLTTLKSYNIDDLMESEAIENARTKDSFSTYEYNGVKVPRVTKIIDESMNREYLVNWAISFGNKYAYFNERDRILDIGTKSHNMIEEFLRTGIEQEAPYKRAPKQAPVIERVYNNFRRWYDNLVSHGNAIEILGLEVPVVNPYYGGCIDCIAKINNAYYILDFKTSKKISYEYILQTCAYMWTINNGYCPELPHINGIGIIRCDKESNTFEDLFLNEFNPYQYNLICQYMRGFGSILGTYYEKLNMEYQFNKYKKSYVGLLEVVNQKEEV